VLVARRLLDGSDEIVVVARTRRTVAAVVAISTDEIAVVALSAVALVPRRRPRVGHAWTERGQDDGTDQHGGSDRRQSQQTRPTRPGGRSRRHRRRTSSAV